MTGVSNRLDETHSVAVRHDPAACSAMVVAGWRASRWLSSRHTRRPMPRRLSIDGRRAGNEPGNTGVSPRPVRCIGGTNASVARFMIGAIQRWRTMSVTHVRKIAAAVALLTLAFVSPASARLGMAPLAAGDDAVIQVRGGHGHGHGHHGWHGNRGHHYGWSIGRGNRRHHH